MENAVSTWAGYKKASSFVHLSLQYGREYTKISFAAKLDIDYSYSLPYSSSSACNSGCTDSEERAGDFGTEPVAWGPRKALKRTS